MVFGQTGRLQTCPLLHTHTTQGCYATKFCLNNDSKRTKIHRTSINRLSFDIKHVTCSTLKCCTSSSQYFLIRDSGCEHKVHSIQGFI